VRSDLTNPDAMREEHRLVLTGDGEAAGLLIIERDDQARTLFVDSYAVPAHGSALLAPLVAMGLEAAERRAEGDGWKVEAGTFAQDEVYIDILEQAGFSEIRRFWHMTIDLDPAQTSEPTAPVGVRITIAESDDDRRLLHRIDEIAFAEHFGFVPHPYEEWIPWFSDRRDARPDLWRIAWLDDEPVGLCMLDDSRADRGAGHVRILGVIPEARGRGIALWLLGSAFAQAAREGRTAMTLSVDSDNTTGATALYERAGMRPERVIILFRRPLP
jgi:ribosomal protein S18 acetylase RimI-like enzyme